MNTSVKYMLYTAFKNLNEAAGDTLNGTEIESIKKSLENIELISSTVTTAKGW